MKIPNIFKERDPTEGSLAKISLFYSFQLWVNTIFWIIVNLINLFWVSRLGEEAIAAVGIGGAAFAISMAVVQGIGTATYHLIGSFNREDRDGLNKLVKQILSIILITSILLAVLSYFLASSLLKLLGANPEVIDSAVVYFRICSLGGIISLSFWPLQRIVRSARDMFRPMIFMALVLALQGVLDYLLITGNLGFPKMGVVGAALSSAISAAVGSIVMISMLANGAMFIKVDFRKWRDFKITFKTLREIFRISSFDTIEGLVRSFAIIAMMAIVAPFGIMALTAFVIGQRFFKYSSQFGFDVGETAAILLSNNFADLKRAEKSAWVNSLINVVLLGIIGLVFFLFAEKIMCFFSKDSEVLAAGAYYLKITTLAGFGYALFAVGTVLRKAFAGSGDTLTPLIVYALTLAIQIGLAVVLPKYFGLGINGVWIAILLSMIFYGSALAILFKLGRWKKRK